MNLEVIALSKLIKEFNESDIQAILNTFESRDFFGKEEAQEVEVFLKNKAINYDKNDMSKTHLILVIIKNKKY